MYVSLSIEKTEEEIVSVLKGNTLRVYWCLLKSKNGEVGMKEIQTNLKFSSPNLALHHLEKLRKLGLIDKREGSYHLVKEVKIDIINQLTRLGTLMVPRYMFYSILYSVLLIYFLFTVKYLNFYIVYALIFGILGVLIFWFETFKVWKERK